MAQLASAVSTLHSESEFAKAYNTGRMSKKSEYWEYSFEDALNLIAKLPRICAIIYSNTYKDSQALIPDVRVEWDWSKNFCNMLGYQENTEFEELMRLFLTILR